jgi:ethanolamine utilization microcompartment shell protein EutS
MFQINLATCEICLVATLTNSFGGNNAAVILANGNVVATDGGFIRMYDPPNPNAVATLNVLPFTPSGVALSPGGVVYVSGVSPAGLGIYNPTSNTFTNIGSWPAGIQGVLDMFYWNGQLYGLAFQGGLPYILAIDVANPAASTIVTPITGVTGAVGVTAIPGIGIFLVTDTDDAIYNIDLNTGTGTLECSFLTQFEIIGLTIAPPSAPAFSCLCATNAGTLPTQALQNICVNAQLLFPAAAGTVLDNNDLLQYVLFSNPADTAGSIVAVSNIPSFSFAPPMQTGVTYYIASMAGNNLNGNVDLTDPCLDFSNARQVIWRPLPAVSFTATNVNLCPADCRILTVNLVGTPPFTLSGTILNNGSPVGTFTQNYNSLTGTLQICAPAGVSPGSLIVQATSLVDAWCGCLI